MDGFDCCNSNNEFGISGVLQKGQEKCTLGMRLNFLMSNNAKTCEG